MKSMPRMWRSSGRIFRTTVSGIDPLGQELRVDGMPYTVIGVSEKQGSTFGAEPGQLGGGAADGVPEELWHGEDADDLCEGGRGGPVLETAADEVRVLMRSQRHDAPGAPDSFELDTNNTLVGFFSMVTQSFGAVAGAIALISLVVGGIVIMNIMLVSVTERTREIGIRKALGARPKDILMQFLIESATMALVGGVFGVLGGMLVAQAVTMLLGFPVDRCAVERACRAGDGYRHGSLLWGVSGAEGGACWIRSWR